MQREAVSHRLNAVDLVRQELALLRQTEVDDSHELVVSGQPDSEERMDAVRFEPLADLERRRARIADLDRLFVRRDLPGKRARVERGRIALELLVAGAGRGGRDQRLG